MSDSETWHEFTRNGKIWQVGRRTSGQSRQTGLYFRQGSESRFLMFTRGALPTEGELESMAEEVLFVLLDRAVVQPEGP